MKLSEKKLMVDDCGSLKNYWYVAAQSHEIKIDQPFKSVILELPIVLWRGASGAATALLDRCNHRNAPLSEGKINNNCLVCPYHGWAYNTAGSCVTIPSEGPHTERIPTKKVESFPVKEMYGLVWVWMGRDVEPDGEPFKMPYYSNGWINYYMVTDFKNGVTDLVENFMDVPHTIYVHKGWFRDRKQMSIKAEVERTENSVLVTYDQPADSIGFFSKLINPKGLPLKHTDNFYMPNVTRVDYLYGSEEKAFIITSTCTPIKAFETRVYTLISYRLGWMNFFARWFMPWYTKKVIMQDVWIMDHQGHNLQAFNEINYQSSQVDYMHLYIESLRDAAMKEERVPAPIKKQIEFWV